MNLCICTKFQEYILNGFRDVKHKSTSLMVLNNDTVEPSSSEEEDPPPLPQGHSGPQGHHLNKFGRGPLGNAIYEISRP